MIPNLITISGTSGGGKSHLTEVIKDSYPFIHEVVGITTRPKRENEIDGKSSHFLTLDDFYSLEKDDKLVLIKEFFGNKYAWLKSDLTNSEGSRIMNISYKSIGELRDMGLNLFSMFVRPSSEDALIMALLKRDMSKEDFDKRLSDFAESEKFLSLHHEDFNIVINNDYTEKTENTVLSLFDKLYKNPDDDLLYTLIKENEDLGSKIEISSEILSQLKNCENEVEQDNEQK